MLLHLLKYPRRHYRKRCGAAGLWLLVAPVAFADLIEQEARIEDSAETILVTARHRQEEIQTVPIPISTVSGKTL